MPFSNLGAYACQNLQDYLIRYFGRNSPQFRTLGSTALIKWLLSPQNTASFKKIDVESIPGKKRGVAFFVDTPFCFDVMRLDRPCTTPANNITVSTGQMVFDLDTDPFRTYSGDPEVGSRLKFDLEDMMRYCTFDDMTWMQDKIARYLLRWEEAFDKQLMLILESNVGTDVDGNAVTNIPIFAGNTVIPGSSTLNPDSEYAQKAVMRKLGFDDNWAMIGGEIINKIAVFNKWKTANDAGIDMSKYDAINPYPFYDRNADTVLGPTDFLQIAPGAVQLVTWNKYTGSMKRQVTDLYTHGTVTLPTTGLTVDYEWTYDYDCKIWYFEVFLYAELAAVPAGGCGTPGVNNIVRIHDCSNRPLIPVCPEVGGPA